MNREEKWNENGKNNKMINLNSNMSIVTNYIKYKQMKR